MSTILNALKKLEQESLAKDKNQKPSLTTKVRQDKSFFRNNNSRGLKRSKPWVWKVSMALLFLGSVALILILPGRFQKKTLPQKPGATAVQAPSVKKGDIPPEASSPTMDITPIQEIKVSLPAKEHPKPPLKKRVEMPLVKIAKPIKEPPQITIDTRTRPKPAPIPRMPGEERPQTSIAAPVDKPGKPIHDRVDGKDKTVPEPDKTIELLEDGSLKVNAISWSTKAEERLAVINSTIVREGQTVEGFRIVSIKEEGVIVQRKGEEWLVKFRLR